MSINNRQKPFTIINCKGCVIGGDKIMLVGNHAEVPSGSIMECKVYLLEGEGFSQNDKKFTKSFTIINEVTSHKDDYIQIYPPLKEKEYLPNGLALYFYKLIDDSNLRS